MNDQATATRALLDYIAQSPTPFHAVDAAVAWLEESGFRRLDETEPWTLEAGRRYYVTRNDSSLIAFVTGASPVADGGFHVCGAHTDSPNLRLKPQPDANRSGYVQVAIEVYGGVLLSSWMDRDLGLAGRVVLDRGDGRTKTVLVRIERPIARVPLLAIHLDREVNEKGLVLNREQHLRPILGIESDGAGFTHWLARELEVMDESILGMELMFHDLARPCVAGIDDDFVHAPRLDNLASCHAALTALIRSAETATPTTRVAALYDNEEIGSSTAQGAAGSMLDDVASRIVAAQGGGAAELARAKARSFLVSADMAHAVHPNYADRHDGLHLPRINGGPVIKYNANARYATDAESAGRFAALCRDAGVPVQRFAMRSDLACGSTIGPLIATRFGVKTVDVGNAMLSMHSIREMGGARDHLHMIRAMTAFYSSGPSN